MNNHGFSKKQLTKDFDYLICKKTLPDLKSFEKIVANHHKMMNQTTITTKKLLWNHFVWKPMWKEVKALNRHDEKFK